MTEKTSWSYLPPEIRLNILDILLDNGCSLASLATVSREWQATIERHNFARISLTPSRLPLFDSMTYRNRALVRYIWVCLEGVGYDRPFVNRQGFILWGNKTKDINTMVDGLEELFWALSRWEPRGDLLLDISHHSVSDSSHWFKELTYVPDFPSSEECDRALRRTAEEKRASIQGDRECVWTGGVPPFIGITTLCPQIQMGMVFETREVYTDWWTNLPSAPAVTGLLLRQQNRRRWSLFSVSMLLLLLPGVRELHYEPWKEWDREYTALVDTGHQTFFLQRSIFPRLEKLVVFENFDQRFLPSIPHYEPLRIAPPDVSLAVARASLGIKHLSASFIVDARDFFLTDGTWPNLTTLALTSRLLAPDAKQDGIDGMLKAAAAAAERMPSLETMEIWNGREGVAGLFRYRSSRRGRTAGITWRGTWDLYLDRDVIHAWADVANMERRAGLVVVKEKVMDAGKIRFHGDAIHHLGLEAQVIRPVSLYQMRMERDVREKIK